MNIDLKTIFRKFVLSMLYVFFLTGSASVSADVTYWLDASVPADVANSVQEAVAIYNKYGRTNRPGQL